MGDMELVNLFNMMEDKHIGTNTNMLAYITVEI